MASMTLKNLPLSKTQETEPDFINLTEWGLKARLVSRENSNISRRFSTSSSYIRNTLMRDEAKSFRSNITISSTTSSPGYLFRDTDQEIIDPSTYSFTNAIRALQARSSNCWEMKSPDGIYLNSKWDEAEKYISNPLSGEVPIACLSSKTLENTSFRHLTGKITMSAPLVYSSHSRQACPVLLPSLNIISNDDDQDQEPDDDDDDDDNDEKMIIKGDGNNNIVGLTRDVGTQSSTPFEVSSAGSSPINPETEIIKKKKTEESLLLSIIAKLKFEDKVEVKKERDNRVEEEKKIDMKMKKSINVNKKSMMSRCLPWKIGLWVVCRSGQQQRRREEQKTSCIINNNNNRQKKKSISVHNHII